jgi:hypothetical protein
VDTNSLTERVLGKWNYIPAPRFNVANLKSKLAQGITVEAGLGSLVVANKRWLSGFLFSTNPSDLLSLIAGG